MEHRPHLLVAHRIQSRGSETGKFKEQQAWRSHQYKLIGVFCVNVNFAAAICALAAGHATVDDVYLVLLNWCDNKSACAWVNYKCKESLIGRRLALVFMGLLLNSNLGIQAEYLNTHENFIADEISRLRRLTTKDSFNFDYAELLSTYPQQLTGCKQFFPSKLLLSTLYDVLLNNASPDPLIVRKLEPRALGSHISSSL